MVELETSRLVLRPFTQGDAIDMYVYARDERVGPMAGWAPHQSMEETQDVIRLFEEAQDVWAIVSKATGQVIGSIGLHDRRPDPTIQHEAQREIGYVLHPDFWGRGLVPEAVGEMLRYGFNELALERVWCGHYDFNDQSRRVVEKCGFTYQFTIAQTLSRLGGRRVDHHIYVLTADEYATRLARS